VRQAATAEPSNSLTTTTAGRCITGTALTPDIHPGALDNDAHDRLFRPNLHRRSTSILERDLPRLAARLGSWLAAPQEPANLSLQPRQPEARGTMHCSCFIDVVSGVIAVAGVRVTAREIPCPSEYDCRSLAAEPSNRLCFAWRVDNNSAKLLYVDALH